MEVIISWVLNHLSYWVITLFMAIESSFIPFPSEVVVPPAAWLASTGDGQLNIVLVVIFATLGADIGALVNYYLARWLGRPLIYRLADSRWGHLLLLDAEKVANAEAYFNRHGVTSTLVGRLIPAVRQLISIPAGLARMHLGKFLLYTTLGAGAWNCVLATIGFALSRVPGLTTREQVVSTAEKYSHLIGSGLATSVVVFVVIMVMRAKQKKKSSVQS